MFRFLLFGLTISTLLLDSAESSGGFPKSRPIQGIQQDSVKFDGSPKLVFVAGPHNSGYTTVKNILKKYSGPFVTGHLTTKAFTYWRYGGDEVYKLVTESNNNDVTKQILDSMKPKFVDNGIILASPSFDQVGSTASYDALTGMKHVTDYFNVPPNDVTVILHYRTPRIEQWISMWKHTESEGTYKDWVCEPSNHKVRMDQIGTRMNPLLAATEFLKKGYNVKLIDLTGVEESSKVLISVVGCQILQAECNNGKLYKLEAFTKKKNIGTKEFNELQSSDEYEKAEQLFQLRDCYYQDELQQYITNGAMEFLYKTDSVWSKCNTVDKEVYTKLANEPEIMYSALASQLDCNNKDTKITTTMNEALGLVPTTKKGGTTKTTTTAAATKSSSGGGDVLSSTTTTGGGGSGGSSSSSSGGGGGGVPFFFKLVFVGFVGYQLYIVNLQRPLRNRTSTGANDGSGGDSSGGQDAEMIDLMSDGKAK